MTKIDALAGQSRVVLASFLLTHRKISALREFLSLGCPVKAHLAEGI